MSMVSPSREESVGMGLKSSSDDGIGIGISIPDDLLTEILLRLPPERAVECRRLSKFYRAVIESDDFIRKNYDRSIKTTPSVIILRRSNYGRGSTEFLVDFDPTKSAATVRKLTQPCINEDEKDKEKGCYTKFVGCCRGILCYKTVNELSTYLVFWNPFTGAYRRSLKENAGPTGCSIYLRITCFCLGYDAVTDDLKILQVIHYWEEDEGQADTLYSSVYSSKADSWKRVEGLQPELYFEGLDNYGVFLEGTNCVHLLASFGFDTRVILRFDFASEKFSVVSLPEHWRIKSKDDEDRDLKLELSSLNDCLCIYHNCLDVWMMKQYGDEESWARVFHLRPCGRSLNLIPLTFVNTGRQLLVLSSEPELGLSLCDVEEEEDVIVKEALHVIQPENSQRLGHRTHHFLFAASPRQP